MQTGQSLAHCLRSARAAWERRQSAAAMASGAGSASAARPSSAVLLADFLTELHEGRQAQQRPGMGLALFDPLSEWLLERATAPLADPEEQRAIQRYLAAVLRSKESAETLLQRPGAAPTLLRLASDSPELQRLLGAALQHAAPPRFVPAQDASDVLRLLGSVAAQMRAAQRSSSGAGGAGACASRQQTQQATLALQLMQAWADASAANARRLADAGAGPQLADLAALVATGTGVDGMQSLVAEVGGGLAG